MMSSAASRNGGTVALQWTTALSVGVPQIDAQHQELFRRADRLLEAMIARDRTEAGRLIGFLREYALVHFGAEEELMRERRFPGYEVHKAEHDAFAAELEGLAALHATDGPTAALVLHLERRVCDWLRGHVTFTDVALGRFLLGQLRPEAP
jgi:hemerythrin